MSKRSWRRCRRTAAHPVGTRSTSASRLVPESSLRQTLLAKRNFIYSALQDGKLEDNIERGGNRSHQPANKNLVHGRDLGGSTTSGQYLPAFERYAGRLYNQIGSDAWQSYLGKQDRVKILIMSGLYGLIEPTEAIQNYDIHLTDTHKGDSLEVKAQWLELYEELNSLPFLTSLGCAIRRPSLRRTHLNADLRIKLGLTGPLMIDSGGFALSMDPSAPWSIRHVGNAIGEIQADIFVTLDLPPHRSDTARDRMRKIRKSVKNYELLSERFPEKIIMPVVHGRTRAEVETCLDLIASISSRPSWVGIGGLVPLLQRRRQLADWEGSPESFIAMCVQTTRVRFQHSKLHVFGAGGTRTFPAMVALGADSADSIGWRQAAGFGSVFLPLKSQRVVSPSAGKQAVRKVLGHADAADLMRCECPICTKCATFRGRIDLFKKSFHNRSIHNAWVIGNQFLRWPRTRADLSSYVKEGGLGPQWAHAVKQPLISNARQTPTGGKARRND